MCLLGSQAFKADVIKTTAHFNSMGSFKSLSWAPERYKSDFRYVVFYYIPDRLKDKTNVKSLIFLHGGGESTATRSGAIKVVHMYSQDLIRLANELEFVLIMPSSNGLQWTGHTRGMLRDLAQVMRSDLEIDPNSIGVSGHSMGGMGITRSYHLGADEFAFYMPMASGIDTTKAWQWNEEFLYKVFNVPYVQLQEKKDHFEIFVERNIAHQARIKAMEEAYGEKSKFDMILYNGDHSYDMALTKNTLIKLYQAPRDLNQKNLYGTLYTANFTRTESGRPYNQDSEARYFWIELTEIDLEKEEVTHFKTKIVGQEIMISMPKIPRQSKNLRVYLSAHMLDLKKEVRILLNGNLVKVVDPTIEAEQNFDSKDPGFVFNTYADIALEQNH